MKKAIIMVLVLALCLNMDVARADFVFGTPIKLGPSVNSSAADGDVCVSVDGLEMYFEGRRPGGYGGLGDLYVSTREITSDPWSEAVILDPPISGPDWDGSPSISSDGLELYFTSDRSGNTDLWVTKRTTKDAPWEEPVNLGSTVNSSAGDFGPSISGDGLSLYFSSDRSGGFGKLDLWVTKRATKDAPWEEPVNLGATVNSSLDEAMPDISADGRVLFFCDFMGPPQRDGGYGGQDLWMATRVSTSESWQEPVNLGPVVNSSAFDFSPNISTDGSTFYFTTDRDGVNRFEVVDIWQAQLIPIVDLNDDGIVDAADMCIVVDNWGTDNKLCDVGPMPWGDGVVDVEDLIILAEHLFEEVGGTDDDIIERVIERRISASADDAEEALNPGYTNWNYSSDLELVHDRIDNGGEQLVGMTFRDIDIAPGAVINNAYIEFVCDEIINGTAKAYFLIWGHLTPNSEGFAPPYVISDRPRTVNQIPWEPDTWNAVGQKIQTVNIAPIIQELIDQEGWAVGNAVEIIIGADPDKPGFSGVRCSESYDGSSSSAPLLHIEISAQ